MIFRGVNRWKKHSGKFKKHPKKPFNIHQLKNIINTQKRLQHLKTSPTPKNILQHPPTSSNIPTPISIHQHLRHPEALKLSTTPPTAWYCVLCLISTIKKGTVHLLSIPWEDYDESLWCWVLYTTGIVCHDNIIVTEVAHMHRRRGWKFLGGL